MLTKRCLKIKKELPPKIVGLRNNEDLFLSYATCCIGIPVWYSVKKIKLNTRHCKALVADNQVLALGDNSWILMKFLWKLENQHNSTRWTRFLHLATSKIWIFHSIPSKQHWITSSLISSTISPKLLGWSIPGAFFVGSSIKSLLKSWKLDRTQVLNQS